MKEEELNMKEETFLFYEHSLIKTYRDMLEKSDIYPRKVVLSAHRLIKEYSLEIIQIKEYIYYKKNHVFL
jgi:hypothetical protein